jgi:hypothetical protein
MLHLVGRHRYRDAKNMVWKIIRKKNLSGLRFFPGKSLLWYLNERSGHANGASVQQKVMVSYLAEHCKLDIDIGLQRTLRRLAKSTGKT